MDFIHKGSLSLNFLISTISVLGFDLGGMTEFRVTVLDF